MGKVPYYRGVRGSAALATHALGSAAPAAEALAPGEMRRVAFGGELLGAVRVRAGFAAIPLDAFDRASADLEAEEQAAYLHLLRLSLAEGRNWCRIGKKELMGRLRLSERRLLRVLGALVEKGYARPLDRDNRGTLWRVYLPREAAGEPIGDEVLLGRAAELRVVRPPPARAGEIAPPAPAAAVPGPAAAAAAASGAAAAAASGAAGAGAAAADASGAAPGAAAGRGARAPRAVATEAALAQTLAAARGQPDPDGLARALAEVRELLAEGQPPERIAACIETVRRRATRGGRGDPP